MKMRAITYLIIISAPGMLYGQKPLEGKDTLSFHRHSFSVETGTHYNYLTGNRYIEPISDPWIDDNVLAGYTKVSKWAVHFGFLSKYRFKNSFFIQGGLLYFNRLSILQNDPDTIEKYKNLNINIQVTETVSSNEIDLPLYIGYHLWKISFMAGSENRIFFRPHTKSETIDGKVKSYSYRKGGGSYYAFIPSVKLQLDLYYRKIPIGIFIAADKITGFYQGYDLQLGIEIIFMEK